MQLLFSYIYFSLAVYVLKKYCSISHIQSNLETKMRTASTITNLPERLPNTPRTKKTIEYAIEESRNFGHSYVGVEHLLLGLLRENSGIAGTILMSYSGLDANSARKDLQIILQCEEKRSTGRIFVISPPMSDALIMLIRQELSLPDNAVLEEIIVKVE
jgi:ATP-dependent Clp protease ATP-binding subunit ClpA